MGLFDLPAIEASKDSFHRGESMRGEHRKFREGQVIGNRYQIERFQGAGEAGEVYQCRDLSEGPARLALKVLWGTHSIAGSVEALGREMSLLRKLNHPGVARLLRIPRRRGPMVSGL